MRFLTTILLSMFLMYPASAQDKSALKTQARTLSAQLYALVAAHQCSRPDPKASDATVLEYQSCIRGIHGEYRTKFEPKIKALRNQMKSAGFNTRELEDKFDLQPHNNFTVTFVANELQKLGK